MQSTPAVAVLTRNAAHDPLAESDYRDIYDEIRQFDQETGRYAISLDKFCALVASAYSKALWAKYHNGEAELNRTQRSELRKAVGMPVLPPTVSQALSVVDEDAEIIQVGNDIANRVVVLATDLAFTLHVNGAVTSSVTAFTDPSVTARTATVAMPRQRRSISLSARTWERVNRVRLEKGLSWEQLLGLALEHLGGDASS